MILRKKIKKKIKWLALPPRSYSACSGLLVVGSNIKIVLRTWRNLEQENDKGNSFQDKSSVRRECPMERQKWEEGQRWRSSGCLVARAWRRGWHTEGRIKGKAGTAVEWEKGQPHCTYRRGLI